jgi:hypothetical protein
MKIYGAVGTEVHALDGIEGSASCPDSFDWKRAPSIHRIGAWLEFKVGLETVRREMSLPMLRIEPQPLV